MSSEVLVKKEGAKTTIVMNRPSARNALTTAMIKKLADALREAQADDSVKTVILTGAGESFCAGDDLHELIAAPAELVEQTFRLFQLLSTYPKPTIAAVNGFAYGGGAELAMSCDVRIATNQASFRWSGMVLGVVVGTVSLVRSLGPLLAKEVMLTAKVIPASEAYSWGLVSRVVPSDELEKAVAAISAELARIPKDSFLLLRELIGSSDQLPAMEAYEAELSGILALLGKPEIIRNIHAFGEKIGNKTSIGGIGNEPAS